MAVSYDRHKRIGPAVTDADGNAYTTVTIGRQVWFKENLRTTRYRNGDTIPTTCRSDADISEEATPKYYWIRDPGTQKDPHSGCLYTWYAVMDSRKICPQGWHIPENAEWMELTDYLGGREHSTTYYAETEAIHWVNLDADATGSSGQAGSPCGWRSKIGTFYITSGSGYWWSSTEYSETRAARFSLHFMDRSAEISGLTKSQGLSIRCIRD
ncbi:MAG: fibrobacter succinogenes major paralogous domain-containing protein [Bacteroidales bacterium]